MLAAGIPARANVSNGTFAGNAGSWTEFSTGETFAGAWHVDAGTVDWIGSYWAGPPGGGNSVDMDGIGPGAISQTIATVANTVYTLSFALNGNPDRPETKILNVYAVGATPAVFSINPPADRTLAAFQSAYLQETLQFTAVDSSTTIRFVSGDAAGSPSGAVIGDISVTSAATPEPALFGVLSLGICGVLTAVKRRGAQSL